MSMEFTGTLPELIKIVGLNRPFVYKDRCIGGEYISMFSESSKDGMVGLNWFGTPHESIFEVSMYWMPHWTILDYFEDAPTPEPTTVEKHPCNCNIVTLLQQGCQCGGK